MQTYLVSLMLTHREVSLVERLYQGSVCSVKVCQLVVVTESKSENSWQRRQEMVKSLGESKERYLVTSKAAGDDQARLGNL